jgi:hypothetical protein
MSSLNSVNFLRAFTFAAFAGALTITAFADGHTVEQCSSADVGRWINLKAGDDPEQIEIYFADCGDTEGSQTRLGTKVFVRQSSGGLYQRPAVSAQRVIDKGIHWIFANVPTGGYVDKMWMRRVRRDNQDFLKVFIRHESLDSKPSATSWHDYRRR